MGALREERWGTGGELTRFQNSTVGSASLHPVQCLAASAFGLTHAWWGQDRAASDADRGRRTASVRSLHIGPPPPAPPPHHLAFCTSVAAQNQGFLCLGPVRGPPQCWPLPQTPNSSFVSVLPRYIPVGTSTPSPSGKPENNWPDSQLLPRQEQWPPQHGPPTE